MVLSEVKSSRNKEDTIVHYCSVCGTAFLKIDDVIVCEISHKSAHRKEKGIKQGTLF
jgi:hypothetical protein